MRTLAELYNALYLLTAGQEPGSELGLRGATPAMLAALGTGPIRDKLRLRFVGVSRERDEAIAAIEAPLEAGHLCRLRPADGPAAQDPLDAYARTLLVGRTRIPPLEAGAAALAALMPPAARPTLAAAHALGGEALFRLALFACGGGAVALDPLDPLPPGAARPPPAGTAVVTDDPRLHQALLRAGADAFFMPAEGDAPEASLEPFDNCTVVILRAGREPEAYVRKCMTFIKAFISLDPLVYTP